MLPVPQGPVQVVQHTACLRRVLSLPRRNWSEDEAAALAAELTSLLRTPTGTMQLRPIQAVALAEIGTYGGAFLPIRVGGGKTLVSLLAAYVVDAKRPLLVLPAKLIAKTRRAFAELSRHWKLPPIRIESYELLGRVQAADLLDRYQPDLIILDEAHRAKNPRAAVTRRLFRYLSKHTARLVAMTGTMMRRSLHDFAHILRRALGEENAPVPKTHNETEEWAAAIDDIKGDRQVGVGALRRLLDDGEDPSVENARHGFRRRLVSTPGVVATDERFEGASLSITAVRPPPSAAINRALFNLRATWTLPNGQPLALGVDVWRHALEMALAFYYVWDPPPPKDWLTARKEWCAVARKILGSNRRALDSELQVANAVDDGHYPYAVPALEAWREVRDTFRPKNVPVWFDDSVINYCAEWARKPGLIWCGHVAFATRLSEVAGIPYYGAKGLDAKGRPIPEFGEPGCGEGAAVVSVKANNEGRNLQMWCRNLIVGPPSSGLEWEQILGRTHRDGQPADEVEVDVLVTCDEHVEDTEKAISNAGCIEAMQGQAQKLRYADVTI